MKLKNYKQTSMNKHYHDSELFSSFQKVLLLDDRFENIESAKATELDAILFESEQQLRNDPQKKSIFE